MWAKIKRAIYHKKMKGDTTVYKILGIKFLRDFSSKNKLILLEQKVSLLEDYIQNIPYEMAASTIKLPKVKNNEETLAELVQTSKSICRFGDGEFILMLNKGAPKFQPYTEKISEKLKECFTTKDKNTLIGITNRFGNLDNFDGNSKDYWRHFLKLYRQEIYHYIDFSKTYYDAGVTRPYRATKNKINATTFFEEIKKIWEGKDVVVVEGEKTRMGVGNDLLNNVKSVQRILCPAVDAFAKYDLIYEECLKCPKSSLFLIALGPTATILAHDLAQKGYRALDLGHLDIEYEWMLHKTGDKKIKIPGKYVNEVEGGDIVSDCHDETYKKQIIKHIT